MNTSMRPALLTLVVFLLAVTPSLMLATFQRVSAAENEVTVNAQMLNDAMRRIDDTLASCTGVLRNGVTRGLTRIEHEQLRSDVALVTFALNTLVASRAKEKAEVEVENTPETAPATTEATAEKP